MQAVILSAGQGRRLLPLTADRPKCLIDLHGKTLLQWQLDALLAAGVGPITVVTGYAAAAVEALLERHYDSRVVRAQFNPFFQVADNLGSCWIARDAFEGDVLLLNGDTVFETPVVERLLAAPPAPIRLTVDSKAGYDDDDMKVVLDGERLLRIGKHLPVDAVDAESIGLLRFDAAGARRFRQAVELALREPDGLRWWYLSVIDRLADEGVVQTCSIRGLRWGEVDFPRDLEPARAVVADA
ncbi:NTP transferase domain-containing protein [Immundisolibacter sp.]|uniref:phosphocholine cytidylyltransferase family protein n=1 Tax=Immundisolibacter sp. TaxID=1934948 RepID=UPI003569EF31